MRRRTIRPLFAVVAALACAAAITTIRLEAQRGSYDRIRCESRDGHDEYCRASIDGDVRVARQLSDRACIEGRTWKWDRSGISVRDGCRAEFEFRRRDSGSGSSGGWGSGSWGGSGGGWGGGGRRDRVTCQSQKDREQFCPAPIDGNVRVFRQLSDEDCVYKRNWNWNRDGIRVYGGCRAEFEYTRRHEGSGGSGRQGRVTCQSEKDRTQFCPAAIDGNVRVFRNISDTKCREGANWSWSRDGVRVWNGCRAEFEFRRRD